MFRFGAVKWMAKRVTNTRKIKGASTSIWVESFLSSFQSGELNTFSASLSMSVCLLLFGTCLFLSD